MAVEEITLARMVGRMSATLDALKLGVVLANADGRILYANRAAQEMMRNGGPLRDCDGILRAESGAASAEIRAAIRHAGGGDGRTGLAVRLTELDRATVIAHVLAVAAGEPAPGAVAAVSEILDRPRPPPTQPVFPTTPASAVDLGLTERQKQVLTLMMRGKPNKAICRVLDLAEPTVKIHVSAILKALKAANRTEAVMAAAALGLMPVLAASEPSSFAASRGAGVRRGRRGFEQSVEHGAQRHRRHRLV
jgi:DNA-binding CsgD family transcriptional regulator